LDESGLENKETQQPFMIENVQRLKLMQDYHKKAQRLNRNPNKRTLSFINRGRSLKPAAQTLSTLYKNSITHISIPMHHSVIKNQASKSTILTQASPNQQIKSGGETQLNSGSSMTSSSQTRKVANTLLTNYGNCTLFKLCNENEQFFKQKSSVAYNEKDINFLMMNTPPSNAEN
jgi:hypothetical protein